MVKMKTLRILVVVAFVALATTSCTLKQTWDLMGKWQKVDGTETMEFTGSGVMKWADGAHTMAVPYKMDVGKRLQIELGSLGTMTVQLANENNALIVKDSSGKTATFRRAL